MAALIVFLVLNALDGVTTHKALKAGGSELNPIVAAMMKRFGIVTGLVIAKACSALAGLALYALQADIWLMIMCAIYLVVVYKNLKNAIL